MRKEAVVKKIISYALVILSIFVFCSSEVLAAFWWQKKEATPAKEKATPEVKKEEVKKDVKKTEKQKAQKKAAPQTKDPQAVEQARKLRQVKRQRLNNTSWAIEVVSMSGGKPIKDTLIFENERFHSEQFLNQGFGESNYTLKVQEDGKAIWETMQTGTEQGEIIFWRGEITPDMDQMKGIYSHQRLGMKADDYSFVSRNQKVLKK